MERERYQPTPAEIITAEEFLTEDQRRLSDERERALAESQPGVLNVERGTLLQHVDKKLLALDRINAYSDEHGFTTKPEFHVTILNNRVGKEIAEALAALPGKEREKMIQKINRLIDQTDWSFAGAESGIYHVAKDYITRDEEGAELARERRESLIQKIPMRGAETFIEKMNSLLGTDVEVPPTHITLASKSDNPINQTRGIGIESTAEMEALHPTQVDFNAEST